MIIYAKIKKCKFKNLSQSETSLSAPEDFSGFVIAQNNKYEIFSKYI